MSCSRWRVQKEMIDTGLQTHALTRHSNIAQKQSYSLWRDERIQALKVKHFVNINSPYIAASPRGPSALRPPPSLLLATDPALQAAGRFKQGQSVWLLGRSCPFCKLNKWSPGAEDILCKYVLHCACNVFHCLGCSSQVVLVPCWSERGLTMTSCQEKELNQIRMHKN